MPVWIDVRAADEYAAGHITGAVLIPHDEIAQRIGELKLDKNADIRVYCRSGRRSGVAKDVLQQLGYTHVVNEGGYESLLERKAQGQAIP
jgi:phage shock protein E